MGNFFKKNNDPENKSKHFEEIKDEDLLKLLKKHNIETNTGLKTLTTITYEYILEIEPDALKNIEDLDIKLKLYDKCITCGIFMTKYKCVDHKKCMRCCYKDDITLITYYIDFSTALEEYKQKNGDTGFIIIDHLHKKKLRENTGPVGPIGRLGRAGFINSSMCYEDWYC